MKKALCFICVYMLLAGSASAYVSPSMIERAGEIKTELQNGGNTEQLVGEMTILMLENDVLNELTTNGEDEYAADLKSSADAALDASAAGSDNAQTLAIDFADKLVAVPLDTFYKTGDGCYIPVQELEHYALTVDNTDYKDEVITVTVAFKNKAEDGSYSDVSIKAMKYYSTSTETAYSSIDRYMGGDDNTFNFTTPKNCNCITVTAQLETSLSLPITLVITNEVLNNGTLIRTGGSGSSNTVGGWYVANTKWHDATNGYFNMSSTSSTNVAQVLTFKAGSTYRLKFKYAQTTAATSKSVSIDNPRLYFDKLKGTFEMLPGRADDAYSFSSVWANVTKKVENVPTTTDWKEYEIYFVAKESPDQTTYPGTEGLVQTRMLPRSYNSTGTVYYDDFLIEEVDEGSYLWYREDSKYKVGVSEKSAATHIRYHYVQKTAGQTQKLINVKYENGAISSVGVTEVGKDLAVGESADYDITIGSDTSKIFLWDGATLTPQRDPIENYNLD